MTTLYKLFDEVERLRKENAAMRTLLQEVAGVVALRDVDLSDLVMKWSEEARRLLEGTPTNGGADDHGRDVSLVPPLLEAPPREAE